MTTSNNISHLYRLFDTKIFNSLTNVNVLIPQISLWSSYASSFSSQLQKGYAASRRSHGKSTVKLGTKYLFSSWVHQPRAETKASPFPSSFHENENSSTPERIPADVMVCCSGSILYYFQPQNSTYKLSPYLCDGHRAVREGLTLLTNPGSIWHRVSFNNSLAPWPHYKITKISSPKPKIPSNALLSCPIKFPHGPCTPSLHMEIRAYWCFSI